MSSAAAGGPSEHEVFRAVHAIRGAVPTRAHAEMLFGMVADLLGDAAWIETWNGAATRTLFRREAPGSAWIVPWPLLTVARGGREGPSPILTAIPGVYEEPPVRPGVAPKIRGLGPGQLTVHDGPQSANICYGADGRWFECTAPRSQDAFAGVVPALASRSASPVELVASYLAALDVARHGPGRVHLPVPLPGGAQCVWSCGLGAIRGALFQDQVPAGGLWAAADGWTGRAVAFGPTRDAAVAAWRAEVARVRPFPAPAPASEMPAFEMPDPPPESRVEMEFDGHHLRIRGGFFVGGAKSDVPPVEPTLENSPVAVLPVGELPDTPPAFGGWVRTVGQFGAGRLAFLRRERRGFTLVGDSVTGVSLDELDALLDAADRAWDAARAGRPVPQFELPPGFPRPPTPDCTVRTYRMSDDRTRAPLPPAVSGTGRSKGFDARSLDAEQVRWQVVRMRRDPMRAPDPPV